MTRLDIAALAALEEMEKAASKGPWHGEDDGIWTDQLLDAFGTTSYQVAEFTSFSYEDGPRHGADAALIIALRNAAPELLRLAKEALAARAWLKVYDTQIYSAELMAYRKLVSEHQKGSGG